jgi:hypothetical protein
MLFNAESAAQPASTPSGIATLVAPCERGDEQPERDASALRYLDEITCLSDDSTRIVDGMLCPP